jgi:hypothetical protein
MPEEIKLDLSVSHRGIDVLKFFEQIEEQTLERFKLFEDACRKSEQLAKERFIL